MALVEPTVLVGPLLAPAPSAQKSGIVEVRKRLLTGTPGKGGQALVQTLVDGRDPPGLASPARGRAGREGVAAQLFRDRLDLAGRHALHIHLRQRRNQRPLRALVALEQLGREAALPVQRNPELQLADARHQRATVVTRAVAKTLRRALSLRGSERLVHLGLENFLHHRADHLA